MPHRTRKVRKQRGSRTHGWGQVGQHRESGRRGGHGEAGRHKHKWSHTIKHAPNHFGKHGFSRPMGHTVKAINVGELNGLAVKLLASRQATKEDKGIAVDLAQLGYDKLLGAGKVTRPLVVRTRLCSRSAAKKIEEAGGQVLKSD